MKNKQEKSIQKNSETPVSCGIEARFLQGDTNIKDILRDLVACRIKEKYEN